MKYHAIFVIFEKAAKFEIVVYCKLWVVFYQLNAECLHYPTMPTEQIHH